MNRIELQHQLGRAMIVAIGLLTLSFGQLVRTFAFPPPLSLSCMTPKVPVPRWWDLMAMYAHRTEVSLALLLILVLISVIIRIRTWSQAVVVASGSFCVLVGSFVYLWATAVPHPEEPGARYEAQFFSISGWLPFEYVLPAVWLVSAALLVSSLTVYFRIRRS